MSNKQFKKNIVPNNSNNFAKLNIQNQDVNIKKQFNNEDFSYLKGLYSNRLENTKYHMHNIQTCFQINNFYLEMINNMNQTNLLDNKNLTNNSNENNISSSFCSNSISEKFEFKTKRKNYIPKNKFYNVFGESEFQTKTQDSILTDKNFSLNINLNFYNHASDYSINNILPYEKLYRTGSNINNSNTISIDNTLFNQYIKSFHFDDIKLCKMAYILAKEQMGCRLLQNRIDENSEIVNDLLFPEICNQIIDLSIDKFGNYFIQKILEYINEKNLKCLLSIIKPSIIELGTNIHGTRVIQKIVEHLHNSTQINDYISLILPCVVTFMKNIHGIHIIQKIIFQINFSYIIEIYEIINNNLLEISVHKHGCCVIQKCLHLCISPIREKIFNNIIGYSKDLITNIYGNYVIQYLLSLNDKNFNIQFIKFIASDILLLSKQKYSSNVIEKCFDFCDKDCKSILIFEIIKIDVINELLFDKYGNYVLQKCIKSCNYEIQNHILYIISTSIEKLKCYDYGTKLIRRLVNSYPQFFYMINSQSVVNNDDFTNTANRNKFDILNFEDITKISKKNNCQIIYDKIFDDNINLNRTNNCNNNFRNFNSFYK